MILLFLALFAFLINIPLGYWRSRTKKFSLQWFLAIHLAVPFVYGLRIYSGISLNVMNIIVLAGSYLLGQLIGSRYIRNI